MTTIETPTEAALGLEVVGGEVLTDYLTGAPLAPAGAKEYTGPVPRIIHEGTAWGYLAVALDAPSWIALWAFREVKRHGWRCASPDEFYEEGDGFAQFLLHPSPTTPAS